jgi:quercetin dioxygenase-like cupin family protein
MNARIIGPEEGRHLNVIGDQQWIKLRGEDTNGAFAMVEERNQPGTAIPTHMHTREDETFYIAEGKVQFTVNGREVIAVPGTTVFLPKRTPHSLKVIGDKPTRVIVLVSPAGCEKMFEELAELPAGQPDFSKVMEICERHGVHFL